MTMKIIRPALVALANAYKARHAGAPMMPDDDVLMRSILQQIQNPDGAKQLGLVLDEAAGDGFIKPSALIALVKSAIEVEHLRIALDASTKEADEVWKAISIAREHLQDRFEKGTADYLRYGTAHKRYSAALYELGLIGEKHGEGRGRVHYKSIADRYYLLRTGGYKANWNGPPEKIEPHTHGEAVKVILKEFSIEESPKGGSPWESLQRRWRWHGIKVLTKAEVFPRN